MTAEDVSRSYRALAVPKSLVKQVKDALNDRGWLDKRIKIKPISKDSTHRLIAGETGNVREGEFYVPLKDIGDGGPLPSELDFLQGAHKKRLDTSIVTVMTADAEPIDVAGSKMNPLAQTIQHWLLRESPAAASSGNASEVKSILDSNWTYMIYPPLLLLPPVFALKMSSLSANYSLNGTRLDVSSLYPLICDSLSVDHIALSAPISKRVSSAFSGVSLDPSALQQLEDDESRPNVFRSPTGFTPLYGDFGPNLPSDERPTVNDFASAFWCTAKQNNIFQTWAPRYVMLSRGNISEKARILKLEALTRRKLGRAPQKTSAVDLYAGIGYFAFSYAKAGVGKVLCWEINPWSIEALSRGAKGNGWGTRIVQAGENPNSLARGDEHFLVFSESNEHAAGRIRALRHTIPPIKHVNCGYLPSSEPSWGIVVQVLDTSGGWIHAHENVAKKDIEARKGDIVMLFTDLVRKYRQKPLGCDWNIECEHVEQVKSYAPGVIHCVFDIAIVPIDHL